MTLVLFTATKALSMKDVMVCYFRPSPNKFPKRIYDLSFATQLNNSEDVGTQVKESLALCSYKKALKPLPVPVLSALGYFFLSANNHLMVVEHLENISAEILHELFLAALMA